MNLFDKAKEVKSKVADSIADFSSDEAIANTIIKAVEKQEKVNVILKEKGCNYRVGGIDIGMSVPPSVSFEVKRISDEEYAQTRISVGGETITTVPNGE